jgi:hypothetical protein
VVVDNSVARKEFKKKYHKDSLLGRSVSSGTGSEIGDRLANSGSLIKKEPGDKNIVRGRKIPGKHLIEQVAMEKRAADYKHYLLDAVTVRKQEILNKEDVPMVQLLQIVSRNLPQQVESKNEHVFTFADMVKKASQERERIVIDTEGVAD